MTTIHIDLPEGAFSALRRSPQEFALEMRRAAAIYWHQKGLVSEERAAEIAGLDRTGFLAVLAREGAEVFLVDFDDLDRELARG